MVHPGVGLGVNVVAGAMSAIFGVGVLGGLGQAKTLSRKQLVGPYGLLLAVPESVIAILLCGWTIFNPDSFWMSHMTLISFGPAIQAVLSTAFVFLS